MMRSTSLIKRWMLAAVLLAGSSLYATPGPEWRSSALRKDVQSTRCRTAYADGVLTVRNLQKGAKIQLTGASFHLENALGVVLEYRATGIPAELPSRIVFRNNAGKMVEDRKIPAWQVDGAWHTLVLWAPNLIRKAESRKTGTVHALGVEWLETPETPNAKIEFRRIGVIEQSRKAPDGTLSWNGEALACWLPSHCRTGCRDGVLEISDIANDSALQMWTDFKAEDFGSVEIEYRAVKTPEKTRGQFYFAGADGQYSGNMFRLPSLKADGEWHKIVLSRKHLVNQSSWNDVGTVKKIRLDLMDEPGAADTRIEVRSVRLVPPTAEPEEPAEAVSATVLRLPPTTCKPTVDGKFSESEWRGTSAQFGGISNVTKLLTHRPVLFNIGYDDEFIYFACRSVLPPEPMLLGAADTVELTIGLGKAKVRKITVNAEGKGNFPEGAQVRSGQDGRLWTVEMAIPVKALGVAAIPYNQECRLQMERHFSNVSESARFHLPGKGQPYATLVPEKDIPLVSFAKHFKEALQTTNSCLPIWRASNGGANAVRLRFECSVKSLEVPVILGKTLELRPQDVQTASMRGIWVGGVLRTMNMEVRDADSDKIYLQRQFSWDLAQTVNWVNPDPPYRFQFAAHPTAKRLRMLLDCPRKDKLAKVKDLRFTLKNSDGKVLDTLSPELGMYGYASDRALPDLPEGVYTVEASFINAAGKTETFSDHFSVATFPWQNLKLGTERIIVPPFKPLLVKGNEIRALQTGFRESSNGFWEAIYALDDNILAKPVEFTINGRTFTPGATRVIETSPDLVIRETDLSCGTLRLTVRREYEQDGFCKVSLKFNPGSKPFHVNTMELAFPLKKELAQYYFSSGIGIRRNSKGKIPATEGVAFSSARGRTPAPYLKGFSPYIWLGEYRKGLCYVCETPRYWGRAEGKPLQTITVDQDAVRLRLHLAAGPVTYDQPCEIELAFQPTPVKPVPPGSQIYTAASPASPVLKPNAKRFARILLNNIYFHYDGGFYSPPNRDWSFLEFILKAEWRDDAELEKFIDDYIQRNHLKKNQYSMLLGPDSWWATAPMTQHMKFGAHAFKDADFRMIYSNARVLCHLWKEFEVFADEWHFLEYRPERRLHQYGIDPVPSYIDFTLHSIRNLVRHGLDGAYYDNIFDVVVWDPVNSKAFVDAQGKTQPAYSIFPMRDLVKRTAVLMVQEKKSFCGYPPIQLHITDCPLVPVLSFAGLQLDWEMHYGENVYQERFPLEYGVPISTGQQAGVFPSVLLNYLGCNDDPTKVVRSALSMSFVYGLTHHWLQLDTRPERVAKYQPYAEVIRKIFEFGYGRPDTQIIAGIAPENPLKITPERIKATVAKRADGTVLLLVGNLGEAAEAQFDLGKLASGKVTDLMTGKKIGSGSTFTVPVAKADFVLLEVKP